MTFPLKTIAYEEGVSASIVNRMLSHTVLNSRNNFNFYRSIFALMNLEVLTIAITLSVLIR